MDIYPAILESKIENYKNTLEILKGISNKIHIDITDGMFVENDTINFLDIADFDYHNLQTEVHLMVLDPLVYLPIFESFPFDRVIYHAESKIDHDLALRLYKELGMEVGLAINPKTAISDIINDIDIYDYDMVQFMTVLPGKQGGEYISLVEQKISKFSHGSNGLSIAADGGISIDNIEGLRDAGVTHFAVGSSIVKSKDPEASLLELSENLYL